MDIKRFSDSYSVLAVNEPGGERIWKRKQMLKIQCRKRTLDFKIPCCAYLVTGVLLLILTVLLYKCGLEEKHVSAGILTVYILSLHWPRWFRGGENGKGQGNLSEA